MREAGINQRQPLVKGRQELGRREKKKSFSPSPLLLFSLGGKLELEVGS